jgi:hypothetical protein
MTTRKSGTGCLRFRLRIQATTQADKGEDHKQLIPVFLDQAIQELRDNCQILNWMFI